MSDEHPGVAPGDPITRIAEALERIATSLEDIDIQGMVSALDNIHELLQVCTYTFGKNGEHGALRVSDIGD